jgi:diguanylate cyclase (GGDEF)-like protein/PAS domain S-box-containing protein
MVSTGAAFGVATLSEQANKRLEVSQQLDRLKASVNRESALEWQSVAVKSVDERFRQEFQAARQASSATLQRVREVGSRSQAVGRLIDAYGEYRTAVDLEQAFLGRGDVTGAEQLDRQRVRPAFRKLNTLSSKIGAQYTRDAEDAIKLIVWGTSGLVTVAALLVGLLFLLYSRREQRVLRQSEQRFRSLVQNSSDVIVLTDADHRVSFVSPAVKRVLGYEQEELLGTPPFHLIHPGDRAPSHETYSQLLTHDGAVRTAELRVRHKDGSWRWIEATGANLLHEPGIASIVTNYHDITGRKGLEARLTHQALHDSLTQLANRVLLKERIGHALLRRTETRRSLAVLFIDLDDFKTVNDTLGHECGDRLLIAVARRLETCLRPADTLARLGGDEFAILLEDMQHAADAVMVAERIVEALKEPFDLEAKQLFVQASIGIVNRHRSRCRHGSAPS